MLNDHVGKFEARKYIKDSLFSEFSAVDIELQMKNLFKANGKTFDFFFTLLLLSRSSSFFKNRLQGLALVVRACLQFLSFFMIAISY